MSAAPISIVAHTVVDEPAPRKARTWSSKRIGKRWQPGHVARLDTGLGFYEELNATRLDRDAELLQWVLLADEPKPMPWPQRIAIFCFCFLPAGAMVGWFASITPAVARAFWGGQ